MTKLIAIKNPPKQFDYYGKKYKLYYTSHYGRKNNIFYQFMLKEAKHSYANIFEKIYKLKTKNIFNKQESLIVYCIYVSKPKFKK